MCKKKSSEYHQSITKKDKLRGKWEFHQIFIPRNSVSIVFYNGSMVVVSREWWRRVGSPPLLMSHPLLELYLIVIT